MEKIVWKVNGMHCTNCALSISRYLEKEGMQEVHVDFIGGDVFFDTPDKSKLPGLRRGIGQLGYAVLENGESADTGKKRGFLPGYDGGLRKYLCRHLFQKR